MSIEAMEAVYESPEPTGATARSILLYLAWKTDKKRGYAWPSQASIARATGIDARTVRTWLKRLEDSGNIAVDRRTRPVHYTVIGGQPITGSSIRLSGSRDPTNARARDRRIIDPLVSDHKPDRFAEQPDQRSALTGSFCTLSGSRDPTKERKTKEKESAQASPSPTPQTAATAQPAQVNSETQHPAPVVNRQSKRAAKEAANLEKYRGMLDEAGVFWEEGETASALALRVAENNLLEH